jgi:hypothetical protein
MPVRIRRGAQKVKPQIVGKLSLGNEPPLDGYRVKPGLLG